MPESKDRFLLEVEGLTSTLRVVRFTGREDVNELFRFDVVVASEDPSIAFDAVLGQSALLTLLGAGEPRYVHGMVARFEQGSGGRKLTTYRVTLVPRVFRLEQRHDCRIFQDLTAPAIIVKVLEGAGLSSGKDFRLSLQGTYQTRAYSVQYRESDWAFACRLMEYEGIGCFFEHGEGGHVLVLADRAAAYGSISGESVVVFRPDLGAMRQDEHVQRFHYAEGILSGKATLRDYDFKRPSLALEGTAAAAVFGDLEIYDYPGGHEVPDEGSAIATLRLEERQARRKVADGESRCARLTPGYTFTLSDHDRDALNRAWLILGVEHTGMEPSLGGGDAGEALADVRYENRFRVIPADVPLRPQRVTPKPTVKGVQSAIVVGPEGEEIYTDEHGRVKVQFHWDRLGKKDEKSSCWLRVSQAWAGEAWGSMHIPRVGQEVLVDFLDGDPDRPIVVGRVYHGTNVPPYSLPAEKTKSTIKSNSTPGGGGSNELRFEDKKGSEEVYLHAQKDWTIAVENDKNQTVGHDETLSVNHDRSITVGNDQSESVGHDEAFSVGHDRSKSVGNDESASIGHDQTIAVSNDRTESVGNNLTISVGKARDVSVGEDASESIGKSLSVTVGTDHDLDVSGDASLTVGGSRTTSIKLDDTLKVDSKIVIECGSAKVTIEKNGNITVEGAALSIKSSADVKLEASGKVQVKASGDVSVEASGKVEIKGSGPIDLNASGPVKVKGANVGIN